MTDDLVQPDADGCGRAPEVSRTVDATGPSRTSRALATMPHGYRGRDLAVWVFVQGMVLGVPTALGSSFAWDHWAVLVPVTTALWWLGLWWRAAHAVDLRPPAGVATGEGEDALRRLRRRAWWYRTRQVLGLVWAVVIVPCTMVAGEQVVAADQHLLTTVAAQPAAVVDLVTWPGRRTGPDVVVRVDGRDVTLALSPPGDPAVGDVLQVVVDPEDPTHVLPVGAHDGWIWTGPGTASLAALLAVTGVAALWWRLPSPRHVSAALRARTVTPASAQGAAPDGFVVWAAGGFWAFTERVGDVARLLGHERPPAPGIPVAVLGDVRDGSWVFVDDGNRTRWPAGPLTAATGPGPAPAGLQRAST